MKITQNLLNRVTRCNEIWGSTNPLLPEYYMTSFQIKSFLQCLNGEKVKYKTIGRTVRGQEIPSVFIGDEKGPKPIVVIEAGSHGREKIASAATLYVIKELAKENKTKIHSEILETADFALVPLLNPDGYQYAITTDENWRKNRNDTKIDHCLGVDVNRNFAHRWGEGGVERDPCSSYYCGEEPFSEEESKSLRDFVLGFGPRAQMFLSIRSPFQSISYPWTYDRSPLENSEELELLAWKASESIRKKFYTSFDVGQSAFLHGSSSGTSVDWARGVANIKYCFSISLPGPQYGFNMPPQSDQKPKIEEDESIREKIGRTTTMPVPETPKEKTFD